MKKKSLDLIWAEHKRWGKGRLLVRAFDQLWVVVKRSQTGYHLRDVDELQSLFIQSNGTAKQSIWTKVLDD